MQNQIIKPWWLAEIKKTFLRPYAGTNFGLVALLYTTQYSQISWGIKMASELPIFPSRR